MFRSNHDVQVVWIPPDNKVFVCFLKRIHFYEGYKGPSYLQIVFLSFTLEFVSVLKGQVEDLSASLVWRDKQGEPMLADLVKGNQTVKVFWWYNINGVYIMLYVMILFCPIVKFCYCRISWK